MIETGDFPRSAAIGPAEAASYLERVQLDPLPNGWRDLTDRIRIYPASPLSKALDNPLTLTLVKDTYQSGDDARELLAFSDAARHGLSDDHAVQAITDHLLDRVLPAAYAHRPGQPSLLYDLPTAQNALTKIAARMNREGTRDLQWWRIPAWAPTAQRAVVGGLAAGLAAGLGTSLVFGLEAGLVTGLATGLAFGLWAGVVATVVVMVVVGIRLLKLGANQPHKMGKLRLRKVLTWKNLAAGLAAGLAFGLGGGLWAGLAAGLRAGLAGMTVVGLAVGLSNALAADPDSHSSLSPATSWRYNRNYGLAAGAVAGLAAGLAAGLVYGLVNGLADGPVAGLWIGLILELRFGLAVMLVAGFVSSQAWLVSLTAVQLAIKWRTPVRLMRFLNDAHNKNVLRTVGPAYQFRHARLQDRLAATGSDTTTTCPP